MKVKELAQWLASFHDQDADVEVVEHSSGRGFYDQGGNATTAFFDPEKHTEYTDLRGNKFVKDDAPHKNKRILLLGEINA
jgi:hypothetical protein